MTGDLNNMVARLKAALPYTWFSNSQQQNPTLQEIDDYQGNTITDYSGSPILNGITLTPIPSNSPVLDGLLSGVAWVWAQSYSLLQFVKLQSRIATASGVFLDIISNDFFGSFLVRRNAELDGSFKTRIQNELLREKGTRAGLIKALTDLTNRAPLVFEPGYTLDTGGYNTNSRGYNMAGGYGSMVLPFQCFVTAFRPKGLGVASVAGYGHTGGFNGMPGGYGVGAIEYTTPAMFASPVTDQDILNTINDVKPVATIAWTNISS